MKANRVCLLYKRLVENLIPKFLLFNREAAQTSQDPLCLHIIKIHKILLSLKLKSVRGLKLPPKLRNQSIELKWSIRTLKWLRLKSTKIHISDESKELHLMQTSKSRREFTWLTIRSWMSKTKGSSDMTKNLLTFKSVSSLGSHSAKQGEILLTSTITIRTITTNNPEVPTSIKLTISSHQSKSSHSWSLPSQIVIEAFKMINGITFPEENSKTTESVLTSSSDRNLRPVRTTKDQGTISTEP